MWEGRKDESVQAAAEKTNGLYGTSVERGPVGQQGVLLIWMDYHLFGDKCLFCLTLNTETSPDASNQWLKWCTYKFRILELEMI